MKVGDRVMVVVLVSEEYIGLCSAMWNNLLRKTIIMKR